MIAVAIVETRRIASLRMPIAVAVVTINRVSTALTIRLSIAERCFIIHNS